MEAALILIVSKCGHPCLCSEWISKISSNVEEHSKMQTYLYVFADILGIKTHDQTYE